MYIDLSKYNRVNDWGLVKQNVEGVILRVGYRGYVSGKIVIDSMFETYAKACYNYGIPFGLYFMSQAINIPEAIEEADFALNYAEKYHTLLPIYIDSEDGDGTAKVVRADSLSKNARTDICASFCKTVVDSHRQAGTYASKSWFEHQLDNSRLSNYLFWVAQYGPQCTSKHRVDMWQYTSNGSVPGIQGRVDCSKVYNKEIITPNSTTLSRILKRGMRGDDVKEVQAFLNIALNYNLKIDGIFGPDTEKAVKLYQKTCGIVADGIVGKLTKAQMGLV